ncbi:MAG TPA: NAD(P)H-quinone oxidoreductase [Streptosporangiaceae bacterium]|jgi:putative PIG3 family NAD(P)H quinone oxidoreductase|nr:NAD(P)H-quinone oxidoreductase [Streptosporangiaceae bacterium]
MRAITIESPGGPEVLRVSEVPDPVPAADEVLIDIVAAGLNRADLLQRQGFYPPPPGAPQYPGLECSGRVCGLGENVTGFSVGDEVCALLAGGGYAEKVAVHAGQVLPVPDGTSVVDAGGLMEVACTVYSNVVQLSGLAAGETLLIHGGASGIGTFAIQLGRALGARVACTAGSKAKLDRCTELGADLAIPYRDQDFVEAIGEFTGGRGADVILDIMGAVYLPRNIAALATGGRLAVIGLQGGAKGELDLGTMLRKRATVRATSLRARPAHEKTEIVAGVGDLVWPLVAAGQVKPVIDTVLPLAQAAQAHRLLEADGHIGKILLRA